MTRAPALEDKYPQTFLPPLQETPIRSHSMTHQQLYICGGARIELGFELKPSDHEIHQVMPTLKHHIARQGAPILEKGLASAQHLAQQCILGLAPLQNRM